VAPDGIEELLAREDDAGAGHEEFEEAELSGGQGEDVGETAGGAVEFKRAGLQRANRLGELAKPDLDARDQLTDEEWNEDQALAGSDWMEYSLKE